MRLEAQDISASFVAHIDEERGTLHLPDEPFIGREQVRDWCVDALHTNLFGRKPGGPGSMIVAGGGGRRVLYNDIRGLQKPYELMQSVVESAGGRLVTVVYGCHYNCGEYFRAGAITPETQEDMVSAGENEWKRAKSMMEMLASADARRIKLQVQRGKHGSAPVIRENERTGKIRVVNPDYFGKGVIFKYPLSQGALDRLESDQYDMVARLMIDHSF